MEAMLNVQELAALSNKTPQYIRRLAKEGRIPCQEAKNGNNRPLYLFPLNELDPRIQQRYFAKYMTSENQPQKAGDGLDNYTAAERQEISWWIQVIEEWQSYRSKRTGSMAEADAEFEQYCRVKYPDRNISTKTLYRRQKYLQDGDFGQLADKRGKHTKGKSHIDDDLWDMFLSFYLDEAQHPIKRCLEYTRLWAQKERPELVADMPDYTTFYRHIQKDVPEAVKTLGRSGEKAFRDRCAPYIRRVYENMASNEWWIADNHTFDVITKGENGEKHRLYLTAFFDARSGIFTGCYVTTAPSSQSTLIALRSGILKYGIPENIYVDNGREFLTFDIGGLGHRKKKPKDGQERFEPPPIFARLGIKMTNAIVRNAKAKVIERRFLDVKNQLSRLFETFTGGTVVEKPERLKSILKDGYIPLDSTLIETVNELLEWYFNESPYGGAVVADRGKPRIEVYHTYLYKKRVASPEDLNLMLMRSSRPQQVTRRGVHLDIAGQRIDYWNEEMLMLLLGKKVYYRYDPENLSEIRLYDLEDRYIMSVPADNIAVLTYGASKEDVKAAMGKVRKMERLTKEALKVSMYPAIGRCTALELTLAAANKNKMVRLAEPEKPVKVLELQRPTKESPLLQAVGEAPDLKRMARNATQRKEGNDNE